MKRDHLLFFKHNSLKWKLWYYFVLFAFVILCLLYALQSVFMHAYYQNVKHNEIIRAGSIVSTAYGAQGFDSASFENLLAQVAYDNTCCIEIISEYGETLYSIDMLGEACMLHGPQRIDTLPILIDCLYDSPDHVYLGTMRMPRFDSDLLVHGLITHNEKNEEALLLINTQLEPFVNILAIFRQQMIVMSLMVILLSALISLLPAQQLARPLARMTRSARELAKGNFRVRFEGTEYAEINTLSETLNYAAEGLGKVDDLRRDLLANVSHDLRTPLTMIKAYAEMIRDLSGDNPAKREMHVNVIIEESDRLAHLVNDMLDLSRLQSNAMVLHKNDFDMAALVRAILQRYAILAERDGYTFAQEGDESVFVNACGPRIEQVLYNLINNAVQYTGEDKLIRVRLRRDEDAGLLYVEVIDTGDGIAPEDLKHIWERYYKVDKKYRRAVVGSGLGLSIVKGVLEQHGAPYGVESTLGRGSTFYFALPLAAPPQLPPDP